MFLQAHTFLYKTLYFFIKDREILSNFNFANLNHIYELFSEMTSFIWSPKLLFSLRFILYKIFESDARNNWMDSHIEFINDAISARTAYKLTYANECIRNIWHKNKVYLPLILNVGDWRMEKGMKSGCQVSFHHRSLTLQCRHFDFRTDKSHLTLLQEQRQNKIQNTKPAYFTSTKAIEWSSCAYLLHYFTYRVNMHVT